MKQISNTIRHSIIPHFVIIFSYSIIMSTDQSRSNPRSNPRSKRSSTEAETAASQLGAEPTAKRARASSQLGPTPAAAKTAAVAPASKTAAAKRAAAKTAAAKTAAAKTAAKRAKAAASLTPSTVVDPAKLAGWLLPPKQCKESESNKILLFKLSQKYIGELIDEAPLIDLGTILGPGVYTWVIIVNPDGSGHRIYLKQSFSVQEFGSKHADILHSICLENGYTQCIIANHAGELKVHRDGTATANLLSGTYMKKFFKGLQENKEMLEAFKPLAIEFISGELKNSFNGFEKGLSVIINDDMVTGKTTVNMPDPTFIIEKLSNERLHRLIYDSFVRPDDIKIYAFETVAECDDAKGQILKSEDYHPSLLTAKNVTSMIPTYNPAIGEAASKAAADRSATLGSAMPVSATSGPAMLESATSGSGAAAEMGESRGPSSGGALITRRHRLRGRTRKIKRKRTTTKKKNKRNKRSNKRKKETIKGTLNIRNK